MVIKNFTSIDEVVKCIQAYCEKAYEKYLILKVSILDLANKIIKATNSKSGGNLFRMIKFIIRILMIWKDATHLQKNYLNL